MKHMNNEKLYCIKEANDKIFSTKINKINNVVFVYTPIKVGSTTLVSSIRLSACNKFIVAHLHDEACLQVLTGITNVTIIEIIQYNEYIGKNVYVIDVYRSPIERKISDFFEKIEIHFNNTQLNINTYSLTRIINRFNRIFPYIATNDYFMDKYNIVIPETFDYNKKYIMVKQDNIHYIKLRLKDSSEWGNILTSLFKEEICIINDYETHNKPISDLYKKFKEEYKLPINYLDLINQCKYLQYYYSEEEKNDYISMWRNKIISRACEHYTENEYKLYEKISIENMCYNSIQLEHYIDNGCLCKFCSEKRGELLQKHKCGKIINEKINHNELVVNATNKRNAQINKILKSDKKRRGQLLIIPKKYSNNLSFKNMVNYF